MQASPPQIDELLLDFVGLSFITDLDQMIRIARNAAIGPLTMGDPRLGQRETPVPSTLWIQYTLPLSVWHQEVSPKLIADSAEKIANQKGESIHKASVFGWMPAGRRQRTSLLTLISCFHALMLFTCSYHYSLYNSRYPAHDVFGYLFGCLIFVLAYRFSGTSGWLERHLFRDGEGVLLVFFLVTLLMDLARFATDLDHADYLGLRCDDSYGTAIPAWLCDSVRFLRMFFHPAAGCKIGENCAAEAMANSSFMTTFMHSFATMYFVSLATTHSWATEISDFRANPEKDLAWWKQRPGRARQRVADEWITDHKQESVSDPFLSVLMVSAMIAALALTFHATGMEALTTLTVELVVSSLGLTQAQRAGLLSLLPKVFAGVFAIGFSCMVISYFYHEFRRTHDDVWSKVQKRTNRAINFPDGRRPNGRHSPVRTAVGIFAAHLYFQLPGGPIKRIFVETFQWSSDLLHMTSIPDLHRPLVLLILVSGMLLLTIIPPRLGILAGKCLSNSRLSCSWCCSTPSARQPGSRGHTRMW